MNIKTIFKSLKIIVISQDSATTQVNVLLNSIAVGFSKLPHCIVYVSKFVHTSELELTSRFCHTSSPCQFTATLDRSHHHLRDD